ncbi:MAG: DNA translocase FtsK 4TM domain-containing protein, partial [Candidatus Neomarinimicrobiota bacterium]|nr:DNA translocase FtsK 4TM domain-containing protein [Candidatus Neomarinimicrobiota bacterium]
MKEKRFEILGILILTVSLLLLISFLGHNPNEDPGISPNIRVENPMGILGVWLSYLFIKLGFGYASIALPFLAGTWGLWFFMHKNFVFLGRVSAYLLALVALSSITIGYGQILFFGLDNLSFPFSGMAGGLIAILFYDFLGNIGSFVLLFSGWMVLVRSYFGYSFYEPIKNMFSLLQKKRAEKQVIVDNKTVEDEKKKHTQSLIAKIEEQREENDPFHIDEKDDINPKQDKILNEEEGFIDGDVVLEKPGEITSSTSALEQDAIDEKNEKIAIGEIVKEEELDLDTVDQRKAPKRDYQLPSPELLTNPISVQSGISKEELVERANFLQQSLETFGVIGKVVNVSPGPVITLFEVEPAEGVRVNKFVALSDDLARVMEASRVRVIAPIPGKSSVGIEIPNRNPDMVYFKSVINSEKFAKSESKLTLAIGKSTNGEIATLDLAQMPHLLIAGTTGSGKSVCMNTILASILYQSTPNEVKFVIVDPKKVEMAVYRTLSNYHLLKIEDIDEPII